MKRNIGLWQFFGFAVVSLAGTLLHFVYEWTESVFAALFSGVNESTWEHMKLLFFPLVLFAVVQGFLIGKEYENFWCIKCKGTLLGVSLIPILFYTLNGIFGKTPDRVNITIFFVAAAVTFLYETRLFHYGSVPCRYTWLSIVMLCGLAAAFWIFTFFPPAIPLFADPTNGSFGIPE